MKNLIIKRAEWLRGISSYNSYLLNRNGQKCCLGFLALDCGYEEKDIRGKGVPKRVTNRELFPKELFDDEFSSDYADYLMKINDDPDISDSEKESVLIEEFKKMNYNLSFED